MNEKKNLSIISAISLKNQLFAFQTHQFFLLFYNLIIISQREAKRPFFATNQNDIVI
jgi:hypothetical protein